MRVTRRLCDYLAAARFDDLPRSVVHAAHRGVLDWLGCALAGNHHPAVDRLIAVLQEVGGERPQATVLGRKLKLGVLGAPMANGQMGHALDYDDTHLGGTILHTSSPVLAALLALCDHQTTTGRNFLLAYACGFEAGVRSGQASPGHHKGGWHITGTLGSIAAGAAAGKLLGLNAQQMIHAMGIAATQAAGMQQNRGTMCKYLHAGKAASSGVLAGLLAQRGFDSSEEIIEGERGFCRIYSDAAAPELLVDGLGARWEILGNGHKPYACAAVLHPVIDAMIEIGSREPVDPEKISVIDLTVDPHVISISGVAEPQSGMQSKFSVYHSAAVALLDGAAGIAQFTDQRALDPLVIMLRRKVRVTVDESLRKDQARASVVIASEKHQSTIEHASGTIDNPMSDNAIEGKFMANAEPVIGLERARRVRDLVWSLDGLTDMRDLTVLCS